MPRLRGTGPRGSRPSRAPAMLGTVHGSGETSAMAWTQQGSGIDARWEADSPQACRRKLDHRLARIEGHVRAVRRMVAERRPAGEVLLQVAAVRGALNGIASRVLEAELAAVARGSPHGRSAERLSRIAKSLRSLLRQG